ncbi:multiheme c-type cytochrome [Hydrogenimonas sp. SS33]|uniref:multiheme c-type cytochrome n=1 Tax=Hydrogenimonas leucolamina TaxID=2954236 RepID=UPI00336C0EB1
MIRSLAFLLFAVALTAQTQFVSSKVCSKCHPLIYKEYMGSMHRNSSVFNDPVHKAVWQKHPMLKKKKYECAVCHTPGDTRLMGRLASNRPALPEADEIQKNEPISCAYCHRIQSVETHARHNENLLNEKPKYYYAAKEGKSVKEWVKFHRKSGLFGLSRATTGSPFHTIDYGNQLFADGRVCLGCHDHKQNGKGFSVCTMNRSDKPSKRNCIGCHMPQIPGSFNTIQKSATHAYHGFAGLHNGTEYLKKYVKLEAVKKGGELVAKIVNEADHQLFNHPLRLAQLRIAVERGGKTVSAKPVNFYRILGHAGKPAMPWVADTVVKANTIDAKSTKTVPTGIALQPGDRVTLTLGYFIVNPKAAKKLGITDKKLTEFRVLTSKNFNF